MLSRTVGMLCTVLSYLQLHSRKAESKLKTHAFCWDYSRSVRLSLIHI